MEKAAAERLSWFLNTVNRNVSTQLQFKVVAVFDSKHVKFMKGAEAPFGQVVDDACLKAAEEISEAAQCPALQRNTACIFHLMRAMELGVARLAKAIGTGKPTEKVWVHILADINQCIQDLPKGAEWDRWSESGTNLYHVKQAWRNDTSSPPIATNRPNRALMRCTHSFST